MQNIGVYHDLLKRTRGDFYIGVVGPVRSGKSTFIKKFVELLVLPNASLEDRGRMIDELPQSAEGKTIMTTEPKFIPSQAVTLRVEGEGELSVSVKARLVDCVGYSVEGAYGFEEGGAPRLVNTPWSDAPMPFERAAELGTEKVIREHSTIGVLVTTDGSFTDIPRENYVKAERRTVEELKKIGRPFVVLLNTLHPESDEAKRLAKSMGEKYENVVLPVNCLALTEEDLQRILKEALFEFPVTGADVVLPKWMQCLDEEDPLVADIENRIRSVAPSVVKMKDCTLFEKCFEGSEYVGSVVESKLDLGSGVAKITLSAKEGVFFKVLSSLCEREITDDGELMDTLVELSAAKRKYDRIRQGFEEAKETGYGTILPDGEDMALEKPEMVKQGAGYGVSLKATAHGYHVIRVDVKNELAPTVGSRERSEEFVKDMLSRFDSEPQKLWETDMFGKSLKELVNDGLSSKTNAMPEIVKRKMRRTVTKVVNEGKSNVLCFVL